MKKILFSLMLFTLVNSVWARFSWPNYVDNGACLREANQGNYPVCGSGSMPTIPQWTDVGSYTNIAQYLADAGFLIKKPTDSYPVHTQYKIRFTARAKNFNRNLLVNGNIPLEAKGSSDVVYKLFGLNGSSFDVFYKGCWIEPPQWVGTLPSGCKKIMQDRIWIGSISIDDILSKGEVSFEKIFVADGIYPFKMEKVDVTFARKPVDGGFPKPYLRSYARSPQAAQVRVLKFPGVELQWDLIDMRPGASGNAVRSDHFTLLYEKNVRLNDRKCELITKPKIEFGKLNLTSSQQGKVGEEHHATIGLRCNGYFDGQNPNNNGVVNNSGAHVSHTVTGVELSASKLVDGLDGHKKIGLSHSDGSVAQNLYVEGSFTEGQQCSTSPIAIGETRLDQGWANVGNHLSPDTSVTKDPYQHIYWKLCKKEGTVPAGSYKGNATLRLRYK